MASLFDELKRRNVFRVGIAYAVAGWVLAQVAEFAFENFGAPDWVLKSFVVALVLGLPIVLIVAWAFELTPEGIKREKDVDRSASITKQTGRKLDFMIIGVLAVAVVLLLADRLLLSDTRPAAGSETEEIVATTGRQSIAVLPFVNMSDDSDHFADGLTEELMNVLAKNRDLKVAGRTSSFAFKGQTPNFREIGDALGVEHVLEGSVRRSGDSIRVTAQLIKVDDGFHVWSETYDREMADIFEIQDDVAGAISRQLDLRLSPAADRPTDNLDAYVMYLETRADINLGRLGTDVADRIDEILALDPGFAAAAELKAIAYWYMAGIVLDSPSSRALIHEAANVALRIDPDLIIARAMADQSLPATMSWAIEFNAVEKAIDLIPEDNLMLGMYRYELQAAGYFRDAVAVARHLAELEPLSPGSHHQRAVSLMATGQSDEAYTAWRKAAALGNDSYFLYIAFGRVIAGDWDGAVEPLRRASVDLGLDPSEAQSFIERAADPENGKRFLDEWIREGVKSATGIEATNNYYGWYLAFGYLDEYFDIIDRYYAETDSTWTNGDLLEQFGVTYPHSGYTAHPKFLEHMKRISLTEIWDSRGAPDRCSKDSGEWVCE